MFTKVAQKRREFVKPYVFNNAEVLELGPFNNPTFRRELGENVRFMDMFSKSELVAMHKNNPRRREDSIVDTDFVVKDLRFSQVIPNRFDLIAAHHVVEHIADLILWFEECARLLRENGRLFLSIPDRRYTFDFFRPISLASQVVRSNVEAATKPQFWQVVEHFYYHQKVNVAEIWAGKVPLVFKPRFTLRGAIQRAEEREHRYTDAHCWVFTPKSFQDLIGDLSESDFINFEIEKMQETLPGSNEFRVILRSTLQS